MKVNQIKSGIILSYVSMFLGNAISILYTPIMLRLLGQSEYGLYQLVSSVVGYLGLLTFGFGSAYVRYYSIYKSKNEQEKIACLNGMFMVVFIVLGLVAMVAGCILTQNAEVIFAGKLTVAELQKAKVLMLLLVFNLSLSFPLSVFSSYITANEQYLFERVLTIIRTIVNPFVLLPVLLIGFQSVGMVVATVCINLLVDGCRAAYCLKKLHIQFQLKGFQWKLFREIAVFSSFIFINIVVDQINWNVDKFLLGIYKGTAAVAVYGLASQLNSYYLSFSSSVSSVFIPRVNQLVANDQGDDVLTELFTRVGRIQFIVLSLILSSLLFFGKPFIIMWAGADYSSSYSIVLLLVIPVTIPLIQNIGIEIQRAKNLHHFRSWLYFGMAICNLFISIPLCKNYGGLGCAIGTAISLLAGNGLVMNVYYHKKVHLNMFYFWNQIWHLFCALLVPIVAGIALVTWIDLYQIHFFVLGGIFYVAVFCFSMWFFGCNASEKNLVVGLLSSIVKKRSR